VAFTFSAAAAGALSVGNGWPAGAPAAMPLPASSAPSSVAMSMNRTR
jgi:hypothetical protein